MKGLARTLSVAATSPACDPNYDEDGKPMPNRCLTSAQHREKPLPSIERPRPRYADNMPYILVLPALALPAMLVIGVIRGRVRPTCCAPSAELDRRITGS